MRCYVFQGKLYNLPNVPHECKPTKLGYTCARCHPEEQHPDVDWCGKCFAPEPVGEKWVRIIKDGKPVSNWTRVDEWYDDSPYGKPEDGWAMEHATLVIRAGTEERGDAPT